MSIERPFLQATYESLHLNFRQGRQVLDQELKDVRTELANTQGALSEAQAAHLHKRLMELQTKLAECKQNHVRLAQTLKLRAEAVEATNEALASGDMARATQESIQTLVASYLADLGRFPRTLEALVEREPQLKQLVDWDIIAEENEFVETVVKRRDYTSGLKWCRQNRTFLTKHGIDLEFRLQMLQYEHLLLDKGDVLGAISYARKVFAKAEPTKNAVLLKAAGALYGPVKIYARKPAITSSPHEVASGGGDGEQASEAALEDALRTAFRSVHGRGPAHMLLSRVGIGLAALKTRQCGGIPSPPGHEECPACLPSLEPIVEQVPYAMYTTSVLDDDVGVLPNNHIIGLRQLRAYTERAWPKHALEGNLVDPETNDVFHEEQFRHVYPL